MGSHASTLSNSTWRIDRGPQHAQRHEALLLIEVSDAALVRQSGSRAALRNLLENAHYVPLTIDDTTGTLVPWTLSGSPMSLNMVAVHNRGDFALLAEAQRKSQTMTPN